MHVFTRPGTLFGYWTVKATGNPHRGFWLGNHLHRGFFHCHITDRTPENSDRNEFHSMIPMTEKSSPIDFMFSSFPQNRWFEICLFCSTIKMGRWFLMTYIFWRGSNHRPFLFKKVSLILLHSDLESIPNWLMIFKGCLNHHPHGVAFSHFQTNPNHRVCHVYHFFPLRSA